MYPNPTNGKVSLDLGNITNSVLIKIHAIDGRHIFTQNFSNQKKITLDLSENVKGIYFISAITNEKTYSYKIFKE